MKKIFLALIFVPFLASCAANGFPKVRALNTTNCGSVKGSTETELKYGKQRGQVFMEIKWKSFVGERTAFMIRLKPKQNYYKNKLVKIIGKSGKFPNGDPAPYDWLTKSGTAEGLPKSTLVLCVPKDVPVGTEYKFDVEIDQIGENDPRARVTW